MNLRERLRFRIASIADLIPGTCWTALGMYALGYRRHPWQMQDALCRLDAQECGACLCGKLRARTGQSATGGAA